MLDVVANNIANVNTTGFKASNALFADTLSQTLNGASQPGVSGGTDPLQIGLGVKLVGTQLDLSQGSSQPTGVPSNLLINGDGLFMVTKGGQQLYTRAGNFTLDSAGQLVTPDGAQVQDINGNLLNLTGLTNGSYVSYTIGNDGKINAVDPTGAITTLGQVGLATFANPGALQKVGDPELAATVNSGPPSIGAPGTGSRGSVSSGYIEMSNVDLSKELTGLIVAERGFQANSKVITTSDEVLQTLVNLKS
jgi:flagellar hook protein FlgE